MFMKRLGETDELLENLAGVPAFKPDTFVCDMHRFIYLEFDMFRILKRGHAVKRQSREPRVPAGGIARRHGVDCALFDLLLDLLHKIFLARLAKPLAINGVEVRGNPALGGFD